MQVSKPAGDKGEADNRVTGALGAYARGTGSEHAALTALAGARLLVPVVAVLAEAGEDGAEKESEMAIPTLVRSDGRRAVIAFTGTESLRRWKDDARPVPVPATRVWAAALAEADAAVIDVAGPVPLAVEGARLRALANGEPPPLPHEDPDIRAEVAAVTPDFTLGPGGPDSDLTVTLKTADMDQARQIALRLAPRCRRGIEIRTFLPERPRLTPAPSPLPPSFEAGGPHTSQDEAGAPPASSTTATGAVTVRGEATRAFGIMIVERRGGPAAWHPVF